jgi:hypothetical protein
MPSSASSNSLRRLTILLVACVCALLVPHHAEAQWYAGVYLGANHTHSSSITIEQSLPGRSFTFEEVEFDGRPFESPQYYGWRVGRLLGAARTLGLELEFIHLKVIGRTDRAYPLSGLDATDAPVTMNTVVQRYSMTHGLNFALVNLVIRTPVRGPFTLVWRAGAGPTIPHAETTIDEQPRDQYEYGGLGAHASAGVDIRTWRFLSATAEYKLTFARPRIDVAGGTGVTTSATHQIAMGLAFNLTR